MKPTIGVVIPVYNGERYLAEAIESVLAQRYRPLQVLAVDDGSTDRSAAVVRRFGGAIRYVNQPHGGAGSARNRGVGLLTTEYLAFLDQDDLWMPDKLVVQSAALLEDPSVDMVFGQVEQFRSPDWHDPAGHGLYCPSGPRPGYLPSAMLVRRASFLGVGPFQSSWRVGEWAEWYIRARDGGASQVLLPQVVARRRIHGGNQGLIARAAAAEYARILKRALDRRRAARIEQPAVAMPVPEARALHNGAVAP